ncbi:MAG: hypothetical protein ACRC62_13760 [Microcoleus sp.]
MNQSEILDKRIATAKHLMNLNAALGELLALKDQIENQVRD